MKTIQIEKTRSLLPNSSSEILKPIPHMGGILQVIWIEQIDAHGLFFQRKGDKSTFLLATHHNGYSCHALAERITKGDRKRVNDQLDYIRQCGGTAIAERFLPLEGSDYL